MVLHLELGLHTWYFLVVFNLQSEIIFRGFLLFFFTKIINIVIKQVEDLITGL
jgi:hypothetical protein